MNLKHSHNGPYKAKRLPAPKPLRLQQKTQPHLAQSLFLPQKEKRKKKARNANTLISFLIKNY